MNKFNKIHTLLIVYTSMIIIDYILVVLIMVISIHTTTIGCNINLNFYSFY